MKRNILGAAVSEKIFLPLNSDELFCVVYLELYFILNKGDLKNMCVI